MHMQVHARIRPCSTKASAPQVPLYYQAATWAKATYSVYNYRLVVNTEFSCMWSVPAEQERKIWF